jgi:hypothetical protein
MFDSSRSRRCLFLLLVGALSACSSTPRSGTFPYDPIAALEREALEAAERDLSPQKVRESGEAALGRRVAWAGILESYELREIEGTEFVAFTAQHRFFDWQVTLGPGTVLYRPSNRGEGRFRVIWPVPSNLSGRVHEVTHAGDMILAYGPVVEIQEEAIGIHPADFVRYVSAEYFEVNPHDAAPPTATE